MFSELPRIWRVNNAVTVNGCRFETIGLGCLSEDFSWDSVI